MEMHLSYSDTNVKKTFYNQVIIDIIGKHLSKDEFGKFVCALGNPTNISNFDLCTVSKDLIINIGLHFDT